MKKSYIKYFLYLLLIFLSAACNKQKEITKEKEKIKTEKKFFETIKPKEIANEAEKAKNAKRLFDSLKHLKTSEKISRQKLDMFKKNNPYRENDSIYELKDMDPIYQEIRKKDGEKTSKMSYYDKKKRVLITKVNFAFDFPIGVLKEYDLNGNLKSVRDFDSDFVFPYQKLQSKVLKEFNFDIYNNNLHMYINRSAKPPVYTISLYNDLGSELRYIEIDGTNGKTIQSRIVKVNE